MERTAYEKVKEALQGLTRLESGEETYVLVALSAGADSMALSHILYRISLENKNLKLAFAHVNHMIRGKEADKDEDLARKFADSLGVRFYSKRVNVPEYAKNMSMGTEEAARKLRYAALLEFARDFSEDCIIATAHNSNDNLETVIFNMARGTSISGVCGIPRERTVDGVKIIRPMLCLEKSEVYGYCAENKLEYAFDSTNDDEEYTRNYIRKRIIPPLEEAFPGICKRVYRMTENITKDKIFLEEQAKEAEKECTVSEGVFERSKLCEYEEPIVKRILLSAYSKKGTGELSRENLEDMVDCLRLTEVDRDTRRVNLADRISFVCCRDYAYFEEDFEEGIDERELTEGENLFLGGRLCVYVSHREEELKTADFNIYKLSTYTKINKDIIEGKLIARAPKRKDAYRYGNMTRQVRKLLSERNGRIPQYLKKHLPVICDGRGVLFLPGYGVRTAEDNKDTIKNEANSLYVFVGVKG